MKRIHHSALKIASLCAVAALTVIVGACNLINPADVKNPQITQTSLEENSSGGTGGLLGGIRRRFAFAVSNTSSINELVSDNYDNTTSFVSAELDSPRQILPTDLTLNSLGTVPGNGGGQGSHYLQLLRTHALCLFGLNSVVPADNQATSAQIAEIRWHKGMSLLMLSESFSLFPVEDGGKPITASDARKLAIQDFNAALGLIGTSTVAANIAIANGCRLALARLYRMEGDKTNAAQFARDMITRSPSYVNGASYDAAQWPNDFGAFVIFRSDNNYQPNPRLDFLDPKFANASQPANNDASISVLKTEEAHLILAEIALSNGNLAEARQSMVAAANLARSRPSGTYTDRDNRRGNRPALATVAVRADANSPYITGLVQRRNNSPVTAYPISYTNQTADSINALDGKPLADHVYMLYLLRQHIFFGEGRRMTDLGIRLPVMQRQVETNINMAAGSPGTTVIVPDYIPPSDEMDRFSPFPVTSTTTQVTMLWDMNKVIAANIKKVSPFGGF
jgi:hypothetical protein